MKNSNTAVAFLRVSSHRQKDNTSHETQELEMQAYALENSLNIVQVFRLTESAKDSKARHQYKSGIQFALRNKVTHILFYIFDRETRNLTDNEQNENLIRTGKFIIHYVKERRIYHATSSDSDFFLRDVQAVTNKQFVRQLRTKVLDAMKWKAESGWFPGNKPTLGYVTAKEKDESGRDKKRGSIIAVDPDERKVRHVQREFELRAEGFSAEQIREIIIREKLIDPKDIATYFRGSIERRLRNPFYWGEFDWQGVRYKGKHPLIIPQHILDLVKQSFRSGSYQRKVVGDHGVFGGGWLKCADPLCGCNIVYDPKTKNILSTGETKIFHYYHCTNGKRVHTSYKNVNEDVLWAQFESAVDSIWLNESFAEEIADELNERAIEIRRAKRSEIEKFRGSLLELESNEDSAYLDLKKGLLSEGMYQRQIARIREERKRYTDLLESASEEFDDEILENAKSTLELAKDAKSLWLSRSAQERLNFLKLLLSNQVLDGASVRYELRKPWSTLCEMREKVEWRPLVDRFLLEVGVKPA